ncbi:hypothetical protein IU501_01135 [Nocardia otitidiscaviarum]|nr:hypothetical protein [Nocardia otitidiscaviarum]MBF6131609.1 hypothetical protein [Nocardia otitidiscaviarum]
MLLLPFRGGDYGYNDEGGVLVDRTADGVDLNLIWAEAQAVMAAYNGRRSKLAALVSFSTTAVADPIPQAVGGDDFEEASEYGVPKGIRNAPDALLMGYDFKDYDLASRFTWKFLRDASAEQVRDLLNRALEADNRKVTGSILRRLFDNSQGANEFQHPVYPLWTGLDGMVPPPYAGQEFTSADSHMLASGAASLDPGDLLDLVNAVQSKGYGIGQGTRLLLLMHPHEAEIAATFRRGTEVNGVDSKYDFIPSQSAPAYLTPDNVVGQVAPGEFGGMEVLGSWGPAWIVPSYLLPMGYVACVATGGPNSTMNPVAFRQHTNTAYQGLRIIPGRDQRYPLQESFFARGFGTGIRHRGAAAVLQVTVGSTYTPPTWAWS